MWKKKPRTMRRCGRAFNCYKKKLVFTCLLVVLDPKKKKKTSSKIGFASANQARRCEKWLVLSSGWSACNRVVPVDPTNDNGISEALIAAFEKRIGKRAFWPLLACD